MDKFPSRDLMLEEELCVFVLVPGRRVVFLSDENRGRGPKTVKQDDEEGERKRY